nr:MAG TPA_asm: hypothetical protein [Caudoviricetes sp.]
MQNLLLKKIKEKFLLNFFKLVLTFNKNNSII